MDKAKLGKEQLNWLRDQKLKEVRKEIGTSRGRPTKATGKFTRKELNAMRDALLTTVKKELKTKPQHKGYTRKAGRPKKRVMKDEIPKPRIIVIRKKKK